MYIIHRSWFDVYLDEFDQAGGFSQEDLRSLDKQMDRILLDLLGMNDSIEKILKDE